MKKYIHNLPLWMILLWVTFFSCEQEDQSLSKHRGTIRFGGISLEFAPMGSPGSRITENSTWVHVFPDSADLVFINTATGQQTILEYNPNDFSVPYSIDLPYGAYEYHSFVEGGIFSDFLPFEARGEFSLDSQSLEISLEAATEYGLVTVKNQYVEKASVSDGEQETDLVEHQDSNYWYMYVKGGTETRLNIRESFQGSTISRELDIEANRHYNFVLKLNEDGAAITGLIMAPFELLEEEIFLGSGSLFFEENGTIKCPGASPGDKGMVNDKIVEAVDGSLLNQRIDEGADLSCVCTSLVTDMSYMFYDNRTFNQPIGNWDVSNVTNMSLMFFRTRNFNQPIGNWDVGNVTTMSEMFFDAASFHQPIGNWDVSNVTDMGAMFLGASNFNQPIGDWDVGKVTDMFSMFRSASNFNQPIGNWNVSNVPDMGRMFLEARNFNQPIGDWDVGNVTNMGSMFLDASSFDQPIGNWDVSNVTYMGEMFIGANSFNQPIGNWDVSNVTYMKYMFNNTVFNQPIGNWDVSNVTDMGAMFSGAVNFNQPIGNWDVSNVTDMSAMFSEAVNFNQPIGNWDVSNVMGMSFMFNNTVFNQPIGNWDVGNVTDMSYMFYYASYFNQPIGNWDVSNVTDMDYMFTAAYSFNQPIGNWDVSNVREMNAMFSEARNFNTDITSWCVVNIPFVPENFSFASLLDRANKPVWGTCPE